MRLLTRLLLFALPPLIAGLVAVLFLAKSSMDSALRQETFQTLNRALVQHKQSIESHLAVIRQTAGILATIAGQVDRGAALKLLAEQKHPSPTPTSIYLVSRQGEGMAPDGSAIVIRDSSALQSLSQGKPTITSPDEILVAGQRVVLMLEPVFNRQGEPDGAIGVVIPLRQITGWLADAARTSHGWILVMDQSGTVLNPPTALSGQDMRRFQNIVDLVVTTSYHLESPTAVTLPESGESWVLLASAPGKFHWKIVLAHPERGFVYAGTHFWVVGSVIVALAVLSLFVPFYLFGRRLHHALERVAHAHSSLRDGDMSMRINDMGKDELGSLAQSFNQMAESLSAMLRQTRAAENKFRSLAENARDAIFILEGDRFIDCNRATEGLFKADRATLLSAGPIDLSPQFQADGSASASSAHRYINAAMNGVPQTFEWTHQTLDGMPFPAEVCLNRIDLDGRPHLQAVVRDISTRRLAESAARTQEEKFRRIFQASPHSVIFARFLDGLIVEANPGFEELTGYSAAEAIGKTVQELNIWIEAAERDHMMHLIAEQGFVREFPFRLRRRDGALRFATSSITTLEIDGIKYYVAITGDTTASIEMQQALRASESRLKAIFEAAPTPICVNLLRDFSYLDVNPAWQRLYGIHRNDALGKTFKDCGIISTDHTKLQSETRQLLREQYLDGCEATFRLPDGRLVHVIYSSRIIELDNERVMISINTDITRLKETETRLKTILEAAPAIFIVHRIADMTFLQVNREFEKLFGLRSTEVIGKTSLGAGIFAINPQLLRQQTELLLASGKIDNEQVDFLAPDGRRIAIQYSSRIIELDGEPAIMSMASDVTHLKEVEEGLRQTEEALRESEARFFALFQSSPVALGVFHGIAPKHAVLQLNDVWYKTFGYSPDEVIGAATSDFGLWVSTTDRDRFVARIEADADVRRFEARLRRQDGSELLCSISGRIVKVGEHTLLLVAYLDITQQREAEQALRDFNAVLEQRIHERTDQLQRAQAELMRSEKLAALGSLVAGIAHELNTPIGNSLTVASTLGDRSEKMIQLVRGGLRRSELENYLQDAVSGATILSRNLQRAAELIYSFKSIAVDQISDQRRPFDLRQIIDETLLALGPTLKKKSLQIIVNIPAGIAMNSYPGPLEQVVVNLLNNSIVHGFEGRDRGTVEIRGEIATPGMVRLSVRDDGCGISASHLTRIFDPFFTTKLGKGGSGLGLHIVRNIVEDVLAGTVTAQSVAGAGTTVEAMIPAQAPELKTRSSARPLPMSTE